MAGSCGSTAVWVWGSTPPAFSVGYEAPEVGDPWDSGFTVFFDDAPRLADVPEDSTHPAIRWWCLHCLIDDFPEVGRGLDVAREWGAADLAENGEWVGRRVEETAE